MQLRTARHPETSALNNQYHPPDVFELVCATEQAFQDLMGMARRRGPDDRSSDAGLGGQLFYAGNLDKIANRLVIAANIAGAATLCAAAGSETQRQALHGGVVDFVVTSLDEALRILKNEIRKREPVAVCVGVSHAQLEPEMRERGVLPDLVCAANADGARTLTALSGCSVKQEAPRLSEMQALLDWRVATAPARWMAKLDALALGSLSADAHVERRWLKGASRYLGRDATGMRVLRCSGEDAENILARMRMASFRREIDARIDVKLNYRGVVEKHALTPGETI